MSERVNTWIILILNILLEDFPQNHIFVLFLLCFMQSFVQFPVDQCPENRLCPLENFTLLCIYWESWVKGSVSYLPFADILNVLFSYPNFFSNLRFLMLITMIFPPNTPISLIYVVPVTKWKMIDYAKLYFLSLG